MPIEKSDIQANNQYGVVTKALSAFCHNCGVCSYANKKQNSVFEKTMRWHRQWCPAWAAHTKVYGEKHL